MPVDVVQYTVEAAMAKAAIIKASLAGSKLRLIKGPFLPDSTTTRQQLLDNEANFDGYPAGGYTLAAFTGPLKALGGGAQIQSPMVNVAYGPASEPPVGNTITGYWVEDSSTPTPQVRIVVWYNPGRLVMGVGSGFSIVLQIVEARNVPTPVE